MAKVVYVVDPMDVQELARKKIVSLYKQGNSFIVARYGVNKETLRKLLKKELFNG